MALFFNFTVMILTITALIFTLLPGIILIYIEIKAEKKKKINEAISRKQSNRISLKAIELRFPFISLIEFYCLKKYLNPHFSKGGLSRDDAWQLRKELYREIRKRC